MKIGITMLSHDAEWGGIGVYTREIVSNLLKLDSRNEYVLIYPAFGNPRREIGQYARHYANVTEVETRPSLHWSTYWDQVVVPPVARRHGVDLLFNPFWSVPVFAKYKKVIIVHGMDSHVVPESLTLRGRIEWGLHARLWVHRADVVISISDMMTKDLIKYDRLSPGRIRRVHHGCAEHFRPIHDVSLLNAARQRHGLPDKYMLFVGMLFPQKNFSRFIQAFARLADRIPHSIVVVGRKRWKYTEDLQTIKSMGLEERIRFLDHVPNADLPALYNLADLFVFPSLYEAFGLVGVEALACGCPVAAARAGALPEVLDDAAVYFDPLDVDDMAQAIESLLSDEDLRKQYVARGLKRAKHFTWQRAARETLDIFESLVDRQDIEARSGRGAPT